MLSKIVGTGTVFTLSGTTQVYTATTFLTGDLLGTGPGQQLPALKVRIATGTQPAFVSFGTTTTNTATNLMIPANYAEHFKLDNTNLVAVVQAGTGGLISITPVA